MKKLNAFILLFVFSIIDLFCQDFYEKDFPSFSCKTKVQIDEEHEFVDLYSKKEHAFRLLYVEKGSTQNYTVLLKNHAAAKWYYSVLAYSKKSDTLYYHINTSPEVINGIDIYYDAGLYTFSKNGMKRYYVPESWIFSKIWDAYVEQKQNYSEFLDFVYSISDSSVKKIFQVHTDSGDLSEASAVEYLYKNNMFDSDSFAFLNKYLHRIENGSCTSNSAYTLNGIPELKNSICKNTLCNCVFITSDDGLWLLEEHSSPVQKMDSTGKLSVVYESDYYIPFLLENKNGEIVKNQPLVLNGFKIFPADDLNDYEESCLVYKGYFVMRNIDGISFSAYKNGKLIQSENLNDMISVLDSASNKIVAETEIVSNYFSVSVWKVFTFVFLFLLICAVIFIIFLYSRKMERHLNKKDKKLIFNIQNKERSKVSKDLHDSVVQSIRAIRTDVEMLEVLPENQTKKQQIVKELTDSVVLLRNICYNLSPAEISLAENTGKSNGADFELLSVIDTLCKQFSLKTKIPCTINTDPNFKIPGFDLEVSKYVIRVFQEILMNIEKHSFATSVNIIISNDELEERPMLKLVVIDDGIGCEKDEMKKNKHHFGIRNMIENINLVGGKIDFFTKPNEGMNIIIGVPCKEKSNKEDKSES